MGASAEAAPLTMGAGTGEGGEEVGEHCSATIELSTIGKEQPQPTVTENAKPIIRTKGITATFGLINFLNGMIGPGCFSIAIAFKQAGLWTAFVLIFVLGLVSLVSMHKLVRCSQFLAKLNGDASLDYGEMAGEAFANSYKPLRKYRSAAKWFVNGCLIAFQLGVSSVSFVFVVEHLQEILPYFFGPDYGLTKAELLLIYSVPKTLIQYVRDIKHITYVCMLGNICIFAAIAIMMEEIVTAKHNMNVPSFTNFNGAAQATGSLLYAFEGQAMVLPLENALRHPRDMKGATGVLSTGMNLVMLIYAAVGFFGYITFGDQVQGSLTLNLDDSAVNMVLKMMLVFVVFFGNVLQLYVIIQMVWPQIKACLDGKHVSSFLVTLAEYAFRTMLIVISVSLALAIPNLSEIIPFVGITAGMLLSLIIPAVIDVLVFYPRLTSDGSSFLSHLPFLSFNLLLFLTGWLFLVSGLQSNIVSIVNAH